MKHDAHEQAQELIACGLDGISDPEQAWLQTHLRDCASCRDFAEATGTLVRGLHAIPTTAGASLVSTTQMRVRQRAQELRRQQERLWMISVCCAAVTLCTAITTTVLWRGFAWMGQQVQLSAPVWEACFVVFCLMPAILAGILLLARGTYLAGHNGSYQE